MIIKRLTFLTLILAFLQACSKAPISGDFGTTDSSPLSEKNCSESEFLMELENNQKYSMKRSVKTYHDMSWVDKKEKIIQKIKAELNSSADGIDSITAATLENYSQEELKKLESVFKFSYSDLFSQFTKADSPQFFESRLYKKDPKTERLIPLSKIATVSKSTCEHLKISMTGELPNSNTKLKFFRSFEKVDEQTMKVKTQIIGSLIKISMIEVIHWFEITTSRTQEEMIVSTLEKALKKKSLMPAGSLLNKILAAKTNTNDLNAKLQKIQPDSHKLLATIKLDVAFIRDLDKGIVQSNPLVAKLGDSISLDSSPGIPSVNLELEQQGEPEMPPPPPIVEQGAEIIQPQPSDITADEYEVLTRLSSLHQSLSQTYQEVIDKYPQEQLSLLSTEQSLRLMELRKIISSRISQIYSDFTTVNELAREEHLTADYIERTNIALDKTDEIISGDIQELDLIINKAIETQLQAQAENPQENSTGICARWVDEENLATNISSEPLCSDAITEDSVLGSEAEKLYQLAHLDYRITIGVVEKMIGQWKDYSEVETPPKEDSAAQALIEDAKVKRAYLARVDDWLYKAILEVENPVYSQDIANQLDVMRESVQEVEALNEEFQRRLELLKGADQSDVDLQVEQAGT